MKRQNILIAVLAVVILGAWIWLHPSTKENFDQYKILANSTNYQEYYFDLGDDRDLGFTHRALKNLKTSETMLDQGSSLLNNGTPIERSSYAVREGVIKSSVYYNNQLLFKDSMEYGAEGPIMDARIVNGKPSFSYLKNLDGGTDIFYDGKIISKEYGVRNPRYLFSYQGNIGFVAQDGKSDRVLYNGKFITSQFDQIHTHNCCSLMEILPTVYENGTLLFYGQRANKDYLVEVKL